MFKNLKKKIEQGVGQSPLMSMLSVPNEIDQNISENINAALGEPLDSSTPKKLDGLDHVNVKSDPPVIGDIASNELPDIDSSFNVSHQLVDVPLDGGEASYYETVSDMESALANKTDVGCHSRTSSFGSVAGDINLLLTNSSLPCHYMPSDVESEMEETSTDLAAFSKEDLFNYANKFLKTAHRYKFKFIELSAHYKDMLTECKKLKRTLAQSQDRAIRSMSELREENKLDKSAKRDLEDHYCFLLEEKEEFVKVLQMQVSLLRDGKEIPVELAERIQCSKERAEAPVPQTVPRDMIETENLNVKVKQQGDVILKCKEVVSKYKEKTLQLAMKKQELVDKLDTKVDELRIQLARLEESEARANEVLQTNAILQERVTKMADEINLLQKTKDEQLEKAREILRRLKSEHKRELREMKERFQMTENNLEDEKEKLIMELSRGKSAAVLLIQDQAERKLEETLRLSLEDRDIHWQQRLAFQERSHSEILANNEREHAIEMRKSVDECQLKLRLKELSNLAIKEQKLARMDVAPSMLAAKDRVLRIVEVLKSDDGDWSDILTGTKTADGSEDGDTESQNVMRCVVDRGVILCREVIDAETGDSGAGHMGSTGSGSLADVPLMLESLQCVEAASLASRGQSESESYHEKVMTDLLVKWEQVVEERTGRIDELESRVLCMAQNLNLFSESLSDKERTLQDREQLISELRAEVETRNDAETKLRKELLNSQTEWDDTRLMLNKQVEQLSCQLETLQSSLSDASTEVWRLKGEVSRVATENDKIMVNFSNYVADVSVRIGDSENELLELRDNIGDLRSENDNLLHQVKDAEELIVGLEVEKEIIAAKNEAGLRKEEDYVELSSQFADLRQANTRLSDEVDTMEESLCEVNERHRKVVDALEKELSRAKVDADVLSTEQSSLCSMLTDEQEKVKHLEDRVAQFHACHKAVLSEKEELAGRLENLDNFVSELKAAKDDLHARLLENQSIFSAELKENDGRLQAELQEERSKVVQYVEAMISKDDEIEALSISVDDYKAHIKALRSEGDNIQLQYNDCSSHLLESEQRVAELTVSLEHCSSDSATTIDSLNERLTSLLHKIAAKSTLVEQLSDEKKILDDRHSVQVKEQLCVEAALKEKFEQLQRKYKEKVRQLKKQFKESSVEKRLECKDRSNDALYCHGSALSNSPSSFGELQMSLVTEEAHRNISEECSKHDSGNGLISGACEQHDNNVLDYEHLTHLKSDGNAFFTSLEKQEHINEHCGEVDSYINKEEEQRNVISSMSEECQQSSHDLKEASKKLHSEMETRRAMSCELSRANAHLLEMEETMNRDRSRIVDLEISNRALSLDLRRQADDLVSLQQSSDFTMAQFQQDLSAKTYQCELIQKEFCESVSRHTEETKVTARSLSIVEANCINLTNDKEMLIHCQQKDVAELKSQLDSHIAQYAVEVDSWQKRTAELEVLLKESQGSLDTLMSNHQFELRRTQNLLDTVMMEKMELSVSAESLQKSSCDLELRLTSRNADCIAFSSRNDIVVDQLNEAICERDKVIAECEKQLNEMTSLNALAVSELITKMNDEHESRFSEYKKRAESYMSQVQCQLKTEKEEALNELLAVIKDSKDEVISLQTQLVDMRTESEKCVAESEAKCQQMLSAHLLQNQDTEVVIDCHLQRIALLESHNVDLEVSALALRHEVKAHKVASEEVEASLSASLEETRRLLEEVQIHRDILQEKVASLKSEKEDELVSLEKLHSKQFEAVKDECNSSLREMEGEHAGKVKQLAKEFSKLMMEKERECEEVVREATDRAKHIERKVLNECAEETEDLKCKLKDQEQVKDALCSEYQQRIEDHTKNLTEQIVTLRNELEVVAKQQQKVERLEEKNTTLTNRCAASVSHSCGESSLATVQSDFPCCVDYLQRQVTSSDHCLLEPSNLLPRLTDVVTVVQSHCGSVTTSHGPDVSTGITPRVFDPDDPNLMCELQDLELFNIDLQAQLKQVNTELCEVRQREKDHSQQFSAVDLRSLRPLDDHGLDDVGLLSLDGATLSAFDDTFPAQHSTEMEYLRNILYQYMMGRETKILARVIATVVQFSQQQMMDILHRADSRSLFSAPRRPTLTSEVAKEGS